MKAVLFRIAVIASLALLENECGHISFGIASAVTIIGWYISGFVRIELVAAAPAHLSLPLG